MAEQPTNASKEKHTSRAADVRDQNIRKRLTAVRRGMLDVGHVPDHLEYAWIRRSLLGEQDHYSIQDAMARGFEEVTKDERPDLIHFDSRTYDGTHAIQVRELTLMKRLKEYANLENEARLNTSNERLNNLAAHAHFMNDPSIPSKVYADNLSYGPMKD